jgi:predicted HicB family RNase H-like nuclease
MLHMIRELPRDAEQIRKQDAARFTQCRLPVPHYEWLRYRAFNQRTSMNQIVLEALESLRKQSADVATPLALPVTHGTSGGVKFNVHLSDQMYEWLRTKAFNSRGSINQLLIAAITDYRLREDVAE